MFICCCLDSYSYWQQTHLSDEISHSDPCFPRIQPMPSPKGHWLIPTFHQQESPWCSLDINEQTLFAVPHTTCVSLPFCTWDELCKCYFLCFTSLVLQPWCILDLNLAELCSLVPTSGLPCDEKVVEAPSPLQLTLPKCQIPWKCSEIFISECTSLMPHTNA